MVRDRCRRRRRIERARHKVIAVATNPFDATTVALTLGGAILRARTRALDGGEGQTVVLRHDGEFCTIPSAEYARLREQSLHGGIDPLLSFLPNGGIDVHRASFAPIATHLLTHERF